MKQYARIVIAALTVLFATVIFQNCSEPMEKVDQNSQYAKGLPFAFDTVLDTFAYMSCSDGPTSVDPNAIFTFRMGAYKSGAGVGINQSLINATPNYNPAERAGLLAQSPENVGALLQFSIRDYDGLQSPYNGGGSTREFFDYSNIIVPLSDTAVAQQLTAVAPSKINYFPTAPGSTNGRVEGTVQFLGSEGFAQGLRGVLAYKARLTLTYRANQKDSPVYARGPGETLSNTSAYGRGYALQFNYPVGDNAAPRVVTTIQETNLLNGSAVATWTCPASLQLKIGKNATECPAVGDGDVANSNAALLQVVRRVLRSEYWYVNLQAKCVLQKPYSQCYANNATTSHYVSICERSSL